MSPVQMGKIASSQGFVRVVNHRGKFDYVKAALVPHYVKCGYIMAVISPTTAVQ